jgi:class 3 adenylate cyclase
MNREQGTDVLVSAAIAARIGDRFVLERVGSTELKGFADPVEVFALRGLAPNAGSDQAIGITWRPPRTG